MSEETETPETVVDVPQAQPESTEYTETPDVPTPTTEAHAGGVLTVSDTDLEGAVQTLLGARAVPGLTSLQQELLGEVDALAHGGAVRTASDSDLRAALQGLLDKKLLEQTILGLRPTALGHELANG
jgi:hypothetical protein